MENSVCCQFNRINTCFDLLDFFDNVEKTIRSYNLKWLCDNWFTKRHLKFKSPSGESEDSRCLLASPLREADARNSDERAAAHAPDAILPKLKAVALRIKGANNVTDE